MPGMGGRLAHVPERMTTVLLFSAAPAFEVLMVWQAIRAPGDWGNYFWAAALGLSLLGALLFASWVPFYLPCASGGSADSWPTPGGPDATAEPRA